MKFRSKMLQDALLLTFINLLMRGISMLFQVYLTGQIGAAGIGLLQLVMTVNGLAITVGNFGVRSSAMYLCAEEYGNRRYGGIRQAMTWSIGIGLGFSTMVGLLLFCFSPQLAIGWVKDLRALASLRLLGLSLPLTCLSTILSGYFTACGKIRRLVAVELADRVATVWITMRLLRLGVPGDVSHACVSIIGGGILASTGSVLILLVLMLWDFSKLSGAKKAETMGKRLFRLCIPLALNEYLRSGLGTLEQFLIPRGLSRAGQSHTEAMASYGTIHGNVFPILMFPGTVLFAVVDLLIPALARCRAEKNMVRMDYLVRNCLDATLLHAGTVAGLLFVVAKPLGFLVYKSTEAGKYLRLFSPLVLMLYLDLIVDGMHKGLGQQVYCVRVNTFTSVLDILLLIFLLPRYGIGGYYFSFVLTHALNFYLSIRQLLHITTVSLSLRRPAGILFCVCTAAAICLFFLPTVFRWDAVLLRAGLYLLLLGLLLSLSGLSTAKQPISYTR